jgi:WD40 repeat protein
VEYCKLFYDNNSKLNKRCLKSIKLNNQILDIKMHTSENYIIILNNINQIVICQITTGKITAVIDLNNKVRNLNNIEVDNSGLFLAVLCEINDIDEYDIKTNNNEEDVKCRKNSIIIFEIGTGNVSSCVNYINPINKMIFDNDGNYLIIAGIKGELSLWKLSENMSYNIKNILNEMKANPFFWDDYEIVRGYDDKFDEVIVILPNGIYDKDICSTIQAIR